MSSVEDLPSRLEELLAGKVLGDLSDQEQAELEASSEEIDPQTLWQLERSASSLWLAGESESSWMPADLATKIRDTGYDYLTADPRDYVEPASKVNSDASSERSGLPVQSDKALFRESLAWTGLAAAVLLCLGLWMRSPTVTPTMDAVAARDVLLQTSESLVQTDWAGGKTPFDSPVSGDVIWDNQRQEGYMRFLGMPVNDPTVEQYQLWIIDPQRDDEPIDGGVFDIGTLGEVIIPIDAKLAVVDPAAFAITIEKPGGVVVSTQDRLPLLASVN